MGFFDAIGDLFGGAKNNAGFNAQSANLIQPTTGAQASGAYDTSQNALAQQAALIQALQGQHGLANQSSIFNQVQGVANGQGPNPAQAMLNNATGQNVANQAALMAGQRGASANPALIARLAAQQGAGIQQNAAGQGAALQAEQSLGALGQLGGMANNQVANQIGAVGNYNNAAQNQQQMLLNAINAQNSANVQNISQQNAANEGIAGINANNSAKTLGGLFSGLAGAAIPGLGGGLGGGGAASAYTGGPISGGASSLTMPGLGASAGYADGGKVENPKLAAVDKKDRYEDALYPSHIKDMRDMYHGQKLDMQSGGEVPGQAKVSGDSPKNDVVPAKLSPGEVVIPKSVMESDDPASRAAKFVSDLLAKQGSNKKGPESDFKEALKKAMAGRKKK